MKHGWFNKVRLAVLIVCLFVAGEMMGIFTIRHLFLQYEIEHMEPRALELADDLAIYGRIRHMDNTFVRVYDAGGKEVRMQDRPKKLMQADTSGIASKYLPRILSGQTIGSIERVPGLPGQSLVIGVPVKQEELVIGALFLLIPTVEYRAVLNSFVIVFSVTLFLGMVLIGVFFWQYLKQYRELEQTRRDYVANISHELKSPIASIKALTETLCDGMVKEEETQNRYYGIILREAGRLEHLVLDMLQLSRMQSQKMDFSKTIVKAESVFGPVCEKYRALCDDMGIGFHVSEEIGRLPPLHTNAERITQLLVIYLDNAVKFVGAEGDIWLEARRSGRHVVISVRDNGVGIDGETLPHVFERFYKEDKAHNTKGSGLGLAIAQEIAAGLNERLAVESEPGRGAVFSFTVHVKR